MRTRNESLFMGLGWIHGSDELFFPNTHGIHTRHPAGFRGVIVQHLLYLGDNRHCAVEIAVVSAS